jgi:DNA processing protein
MDLQKELFACLALKHTPYLGPRVWKQLSAHFPSVYEAVQAADSWPSLGVKSRYLKRVVKGCRSELWRSAAEEEFRAARKTGMDAVTWFDPRFPESLKGLEDAPCMLYVRGDVSLFHNPGVAVVGARECTPMGLEATGRISTQLSKSGVTVISGLALGIDRQAHLGGLRGIGSSVAVLGCGLDVDYPKDNRDVRLELEEKGLVVTEYGPGVRPRPEHFPVRNRLISGLALGVLVAEAAHDSGSLITARLAGEQGRDVFALPGPIGQPTFTGCHRLIKQGAALVESAGDIVEILRYDFARELADVPDPAPVEPGDEIGVDEARVKQGRGEKAEGKKKAGPLKKAADPPEKKEEEKLRKRPGAVEREGIELSGEERAVMSILDPADKVHIDALGRELGWAPHVVSKVLIILEMKGAIQQLPGMWYLAREE